MFINIIYMKAFYKIFHNAAADTFFVPVMLSVLLSSIVSGLVILIWFLIDTKPIQYSISMADVIFTAFALITAIFTASMLIVFVITVIYSVSAYFCEKHKTKQSHQDTNS